MSGHSEIPFLPRPSRLFVLLAGLVLAGCQSTREVFLDQALDRPHFQPTNHQGERQLPANIRRVLVLPVYAGQTAGEAAVQAIDEVVFQSLQKTARFEVVVLTREECQRRFRQREFSSAGVLPHNFLSELGRVYAAEAVLFVDLTVYEPYRPLALGYRAKLAAIEDIRILWTFDETFSAADQAVVNSARRYSQQQGKGQSPVDMTIGTLQSPRRFAAYAADTMFATLPPR